MLPDPDQCGHLYPHPHPTISDTLFATNPYVEDTGYGVWKSEDAGQTWVSKINGLTDTQVVDLTFHPSDPMTMAVGTHSGVFISYNGGDDWSFVAQPVNFIEMLTFTPLDDHELWASANWYYGTRSTHWTTNADFTAWEQLPDPVGSESMAHAYFGETNWGAAYSQTVFLAMCSQHTYKSEDGGASWSNYGIDGKDLALHASDPHTVYAAHPSDGIHKTEDDGANWQPMNEGLTGVAPDALAASSHHPDVVYAVDRVQEGIYRGTQGGAAWQYEEIDDLDASAVLADPFGSNRVYAAGRGWSTPDALVCISDDGGESWIRPCSLITAPTVYSDTSFGDLELGAVDPDNPGTLLAGAHHFRFRLGSTVLHTGSIYKSTDYGQSWTWIDVGQTISPVNDLAYDHLTPTIVYASTGVMGEGSGLLKSNDAGETWQRVGEEHPALDWVENIAVEPVAPYRVFAQPENMAGLYVSEDHGETWQQADAPLAGYNIHDLLFTADTGVLYAATNRGLFRSLDGAQTWARASGALGWIPVYSLATVSADDRAILYAGTTGGTAPVAGTQTRGMGALAETAETNVVNAGVYRNTSLRSQQTAPGQPGWVQVAAGGFGDADNFLALSLTSFEGSLYAGTINNDGAQMWQSTDGNTWQQLASAWSPTHTAILALQNYGSRLYVGTGAPPGVPVPGELWRTDGVNWTQVISDGFGDVNNRGVVALDVFSDMLYAAVDNPTTGLEIWRSESGDPGTWSQVNEDSFDEAGLVSRAQMCVCSDTLYVGVGRDGVAELWRTGDGLNWTPVFTDGLGNTDNEAIHGIAEFNGDLYVGLLNNSTGGELWRFDGTWAKVFDGGLGNPDNIGPYVVTELNEQLHVVFDNGITGAEAWKTADGSAWERTNLNGWGDSSNSGVGGATVFDHQLYVGTFNWDGGAEIWRYGFEIYLPLVLRDAP